MRRLAFLVFTVTFVLIAIIAGAGEKLSAKVINWDKFGFPFDFPGKTTIVAEEKPAPAMPPSISAAPAPVETKLRAERFCTDTLLVYDKDGKPETMMFLDKNGTVFATVKVK